MTWLNRSLVNGPYLKLCVNEKQFRAALRHLELPRGQWPKNFVTPGAGATTWTFEKDGGDVCCVVCFPLVKHSKISIHGLLVHEAVHVWQQARDTMIKEVRPISEFEAYAIQSISETLMDAYERESKRKKA